VAKRKKPKPTLTLLSGPTFTAEDLAALFERLTGRRPSEQEMAEARETLAKAAGGTTPAHKPPGGEETPSS